MTSRTQTPSVRRIHSENLIFSALLYKQMQNEKADRRNKKKPRAPQYISTQLAALIRKRDQK